MAHKTIDEYIKSTPKAQHNLLNSVRQAVQQAAPNAEEAISYGIPTFKLNGKNLVHFAAFKNHIGFYATPSGRQAFQTELAKYPQGKGSVQFPLDKPLPLGLIAKITKYRVAVLQS